MNLGRETLLTRTLIIASGASARWLGLPSEQALIGHGVSSCATCDGFFFSGKEIVVIGGGDSAMEEALFLTRFATKVTIIHRRGEFRASKIMLDRARKHEQIQFLTDTVVDDVYDVNKKEVTGLRLRNVKTGEQWDFPTSAMFLGIGHTPNADFVGDQLKRDGEGYLIPEGYRLARACRECLSAATWPTAIIARRLPLPAPDAWPRWKWRSIWKRSGSRCNCRRFADSDSPAFGFAQRQAATRSIVGGRFSSVISVPPW